MNSSSHIGMPAKSLANMHTHWLTIHWLWEQNVGINEVTRSAMNFNGNGKFNVFSSTKNMVG